MEIPQHTCGHLPIYSVVAPTLSMLRFSFMEQCERLRPKMQIFLCEMSSGLVGLLEKDLTAH